MRRVLAFILAAPLLAQSSEGRFELDFHLASPSLSGRLEGVQDGQPIAVDLKQDLGLEKDTSMKGAGLEYQGPRFGLELAVDSQDYKGQSQLDRTITIDGQDFNVGMTTHSKLSLQTSTLNWTIRFMHPNPVWVGVDLGVRVWNIDLKVDGQDPLTTIPAQAGIRVPVPIPQVGLSAGFQILDKQLTGKGFYHLLTYRGAKYHQAGADLRYFPIKHLGIRAYVTNEIFDVPKGSIKDDLELHLDRSGSGFGLVLQF